MATRPVPQDRQGKKQPLQLTVTVPLNDECLDALEAARADLAAGEEKAEQERERLFRLMRQPGQAPAELLEMDRLIGEQIGKDLAPLRDAVEAAETAAREQSQEYVFRSIGRHAYRALRDEHPPLDTDHDELRRSTGNENAVASWNGETFPPALVLASCAEPTLSEDDVVEMWETWNQAELIDLFLAAQAVNEQRRVVDLGKARG